MSITETSTDVSVSVKAGELVSLLKNVLPFAGTDATLPILCTVRLRLADGRLQAATTDRYTAGRDSIPAELSEGEFEFILSVKDAKLLISSIGKPQAYEWAELRPVDGKLAVTLLSGSSFSFAPVDGTWPQLDRLFEYEPCERTQVNFNPAYLAKFAKVVEHSAYRRSHTPLRLSFAPSGADNVRGMVAIGETFTGIIISIRITS